MLTNGNRHRLFATNSMALYGVIEQATSNHKVLYRFCIALIRGCYINIREIVDEGIYTAFYATGHAMTIAEVIV
jgi:hypothetical protein